MTKDEAKNVLIDTFKAAWCTSCVVWDEPVWSNCNEYCDEYKQFKEAIEALYHHTEKTDNISTKVKSDLISREGAIDAVQAYLDILINSRRHGDDFTFINVLTEIRNKISALPTADAVNREDFTKAIKAGAIRSNGGTG